MPTVIPVKFAYATRDLWFDPRETGAVEGDHVICSTERGTEMGLATGDPMEIDEAELNRKTDGAALKPVVRIAGEEDFVRADELSARGDAAMPTFRRLVSKSGLDMKPVGVEYIFGGEKVVCYFSADERIDFRQLVRDLSRELHERVDMRQVGVREEAALVGGFGHCGQELCCARFGSGFEPVSIRMAKEQDLPLNSNKISGACGRLMCCLRYEFEAYRDFKQRAPRSVPPRASSMTPRRNSWPFALRTASRFASRSPRWRPRMPRARRARSLVVPVVLTRLFVRPWTAWRAPRFVPRLRSLIARTASCLTRPSPRMTSS